MASKDFIDQIRALIEEYPHDQAQLAEAWRAQMNARPNAQPISENTPPTRLSGLRNGKIEGVRYFFKDRQRANPLLEILEVPFEAREALLLEAETYLDHHDATRPRLFVPLALYSEGLPEGIWARLRRWLETPETPRPMVLCVNDAQWDQVPRSFDEIGGLAVKRAEADEARAMAEEIAARGGLVAAPEWGLVPYERWIVVDLKANDEVLRSAPDGWRARYAEEGQLDALPTPARPLDALDFKADERLDRYPQGLALRAHLAALASGEGALSPAQRLAQAKALGITAGATAEEVAAFEIREEDRRLTTAAEAAGVQIEALSPEALQARLDRARVRPLKAICRVGDHWHWINLTPPEGFEVNARVERHEIEAPLPALERLWAQIKGWTTADLAADPMLHGVVKTLDPESVERAAFDLARAWMLEGQWSGWPASAPTNAALEPLERDPTEALGEVIDAPLVETELRLVERNGPHWARADEIPRWQDPQIGVFRAPPRGDLEVRRGQTVKVIQGRSQVSQNKGLLAVDFVPSKRRVGDTEAQDSFCDQLIARLDPEIEAFCLKYDYEELQSSWETLIQNCTSRSNSYGKLTWNQSRLNMYHHKVQMIKTVLNGPLPDPDTKPNWPIKERLGPHAVEVIPQHPQLWRHADHFIAQLRRSLRRGLDDAVSLPNGALSIPLREGTETYVTLRRSDADTPKVIIEASIREGFASLAWDALRDHDLELEVNQAWSGSGQPIPSDLPEAVELHAAGVCARITFVPDLLKPLSLARVDATLSAIGEDEGYEDE